MSSSIPEYTSQPFTVNGDYIPVPGDFNGDFIDDILSYQIFYFGVKFSLK